MKSFDNRQQCLEHCSLQICLALTCWFRSAARPPSCHWPLHCPVLPSCSTQRHPTPSHPRSGFAPAQNGYSVGVIQCHLVPSQHTPIHNSTSEVRLCTRRRQTSAWCSCSVSLCFHDVNIYTTLRGVRVYVGPPRPAKRPMNLVFFCIDHSLHAESCSQIQAVPARQEGTELCALFTSGLPV